MATTGQTNPRSIPNGLSRGTRGKVFCSICPVVLLAAAVYFLIERPLAIKHIRLVQRGAPQLCLLVNKPI